MLLPKTNAYHSTNVERTNFVGDGASTSRYDGFIATSYDIRVCLRAVEFSLWLGHTRVLTSHRDVIHYARVASQRQPLQKTNAYRNTNGRAMHAHTNAIQYGSTLSKKFPQKPFFGKRFWRWGCGGRTFFLEKVPPPQKKTQLYHSGSFRSPGLIHLIL